LPICLTYFRTSESALTPVDLEGSTLGLPTSEFFDTAWYTREYPDVNDSGMNALAHFLRFGLLEGRIPINIIGMEARQDLIRQAEQELQCLDLLSRKFFAKEVSTYFR